MTLMLSIKDVSVEYPAKKVLDRVTLGINTGESIGIVGKNGDGKSTLLKVLSGNLQPDSGEVLHNGSQTIGLLGQSDLLNNASTAIEAVVGDAATYTWAADKKSREIIEALLGDVPLSKTVGELSGGQRRRIDLARLLIKDWDILLLDEPTNHLDMRAITWLSEHLKTRWTPQSGALLVVTHDRWFLDEVSLGMWEVHDGRVDMYEGGFSAYIQQRVERERLIQKAEERRKNALRKELAWLSRGARARATKPKFHLKAALALVESDPPLRNKLELKQASMTRLGKQVVELDEVSKSYGDDTVLEKIDWIVGPGDRVGILGENGVGKSTLLNVITQKTAPSSGLVKIGKTVKMAMLTQRLSELEEFANDRVREVLGRHKTRLDIDGKSVTTSQMLENLGFERAHLQSYVKDLSGGQKRRLQLLLVLVDEPNVLILDEPGNDMDVDMLAVMEDLLDYWPGTLFLVSHDRYLMERVTDNQYAIIDKSIRHVPGGVDEYLKLLNSKERPPLIESSVAASHSNEQQTDTEALTKKPLSGGDSYEARKQLASIERKISTIDDKIATAISDMYNIDMADYIALGKSEQYIKELQAEKESLEDEWLGISESLGN